MKKILKNMLILCGLSAFLSAQASVVPQEKTISYSVVGEGKPLVLIHAFPTDQQLWKPQQKALSKHFRVITLDLWGFGGSSSTDGTAISMEKYADEVKQLLDQLHVKKTIIGGESMGGYITLAFLKKYPEHVKGLILADTQSIADTAEAKVKRETSALDVLTNGSQTFLNGFKSKALSTMASLDVKNDLNNIVDHQSPTAIASALRGMALREDTTNVLASTKIPVLILTGDQDVLISPQQSQNMHSIAKNSRLVTLTNSGHLSNLEQPEQWNQAVIDMFQ
jgi:pimeloyl-ACP methyl ester carboxylesterase